MFCPTDRFIILMTMLAGFTSAHSRTKDPFNLITDWSLQRERHVSGMLERIGTLTVQALEAAAQ